MILLPSQKGRMVVIKKSPSWRFFFAYIRHQHLFARYCRKNQRRSPPQVSIYFQQPRQHNPTTFALAQRHERRGRGTYNDNTDNMYARQHCSRVILDGILQKYLCGIHRLFVEYSQHIHVIYVCMAYVSGMYRVCVGYVSGMCRDIQDTVQNSDNDNHVYCESARKLTVFLHFKRLQSFQKTNIKTQQSPKGGLFAI